MNIKTGPELELIVKIVFTKEKSFTIKNGKTLNDINWKKFVDLCAHHNVIPLVYKKIRSEGEGIFPDETIALLKDLYHKIVQWNFIQANQLKKVLRILEENNIKGIPVKGPAISVQAYGDIGNRMFQDLDLLIFPEDFIDVYNILNTEGYEPAVELSEKKKKLWRRYRKDLEFKKGKTLIDIHQRLSQGYSLFDLTEELVERCDSVDILDKSLRVLSAEDTLIYLSINGTKDEWFKLRMITDMSGLISLHPEMDWDAVLKIAKRMGIKRMVLTGLQLMSEVSGVTLPDTVLSEISGDIKIKELGKYYKEKLLTKTGDSFARERTRSVLNTLDSSVYRIRYYLYFLFTPTPHDLDWVSLPESLYFLYRILRPLRLIITAMTGKEISSEKISKK